MTLLQKSISTTNPLNKGSEENFLYSKVSEAIKSQLGINQWINVIKSDKNYEKPQYFYEDFQKPPKEKALNLRIL